MKQTSKQMLPQKTVYKRDQKKSSNITNKESKKGTNQDSKKGQNEIKPLYNSPQSPTRPQKHEYRDNRLSTVQLRHREASTTT